ncbi:ExbD/TolR family protein [Alterisphingorhabdus coralli]|uniref:Biopolymer transporter ExbD n=1 Tax=Alterisphingorhabdus coralli TaxID=3071408 RepID=A0AA97F6I3_9SPHN|nr:biopolymer transporter ExbD [Parasphingorhabdus sp. SCSIO 66989]WOE74851.1 biopolymer transporter ExbD [Parasphingorhabdus sp. SCSIO 66989]
MAMSGGKDDGSPMMDMNTTPLIDVMLVLLIMFIITIPPQMHAVKLDLPQPDDSQNVPPVDPVRNKLIVSPDDSLLWNGEAVSLSQVEELLARSMAMDVEPELQFQPDAVARYERVNQVLRSIKVAQVTKFGFVGNEQYRVFTEG